MLSDHALLDQSFCLYQSSDLSFCSSSPISHKSVPSHYISEVFYPKLFVQAAVNNKNHQTEFLILNIFIWVMSMFLLTISTIQILMFIAGHVRKTKLKVTKKHKPYWHVIHFNTCHL